MKKILALGLLLISTSAFCAQLGEHFHCWPGNCNKTMTACKWPGDCSNPTARSCHWPGC